jgi:hypothetical protein
MTAASRMGEKREIRVGVNIIQDPFLNFWREHLSLLDQYTAATCWR